MEGIWLFVWPKQKNNIEKKKETVEKKFKERDKRNLFLAEEGVIKPDSEEAKALPEMEKQRRAKMWKEKKNEVIQSKFPCLQN